MADDRKSLELQIRIATQEALKAVSSLKGEVQALAGEAKKFAGSGGAALKDSFRDAEKAAKDTARGIDEIKGAIGKLAEVAALTKALSVIKDMGAFALQTADNFQTARNQFGTLLGDMEAGAGLFNEIKAFNDKTPFDLDTLTQATNVLISAKVPLADLQEQLTKFGDLSQGNSQKFTSYINAFSQASAKGKADLQILNTYMNQGVPILDALAKGFGVTTSEIMEMTSKGQISFADFSKALEDLTAAGGQYFGGMELGSQSLAAMQEGLSEAVNSLAASFGEMLLPAAISVVEALTSITNAINESPILKGVFAGALVTLTGLMAAKAVQATIAFAAQMKLNFAIGALNPAVMAATIAVAALAAGFTIYTSKQQQAARETENLAFQQRQQKEATDAAADAIIAYADAIRGLTDADIDRQILFIRKSISEFEKSIGESEGQYERAITSANKNLADYWSLVIEAEKQGLERALNDLKSAEEVLAGRRTSWIDSMFGNTETAKLEKLTAQLAVAQGYLIGSNLSSDDRGKLLEIIKNLNAEIDNITGKADRMAASWKSAWADAWAQFQAEESGDPFAGINLEHRKKLEDAYNNHVRQGSQETIDQINAYYDAKRSEVNKKLMDEEERMMRGLTGSRISNIEYEMSETLKAINALEAQRVFAAVQSEEEISRIREQYAQMRKTAEEKYSEEIFKAQFEEAKAAIVDWQAVFSDSLALALMNIKDFSDEAAIILGQLSTQLAELSANAALSGFEEFGRALGEGKDAAESLQQALAAMAQQILRQLPMMFMQAGLQLIANGQWALGLGFIAAAGTTAIISGFVDGAAKNAQGGVYDEYGKAARAFAAGGTFTNQIVSQPTYFRFGGKLGVMGEAGPEAIMPLARMPNGNLGVEAYGGGGGTHVIVNIINNSNADVRSEERTDSEGNTQIDVIVGKLVDSHITSGKADRAMGARYGLRPTGV